MRNPIEYVIAQCIMNIDAPIGACKLDLILNDKKKSYIFVQVFFLPCRVCTYFFIYIYK